MSTASGVMFVLPPAFCVIRLRLGKAEQQALCYCGIFGMLAVGEDAMCCVLFFSSFYNQMM